MSYHDLVWLIIHYHALLLLLIMISHFILYVDVCVICSSHSVLLQCITTACYELFWLAITFTNTCIFQFLLLYTSLCNDALAFNVLWHCVHTFAFAYFDISNSNDYASLWLNERCILLSPPWFLIFYDLLCFQCSVFLH